MVTPILCRGGQIHEDCAASGGHCSTLDGGAWSACFTDGTMHG